MAMAVLGNLAAQFLPGLISWGIGKLRNSNLGRGPIHRVINRTKSFFNNPLVKPIGMQLA
jgi:hypothetical protein